MEQLITTCINKAKKEMDNGLRCYDLTPTQLANMKECMPRIKAARKEGKLAFYKQGRVMIMEKHTK